MKATQRAHGFGAIGIVLIVAVLALAGLGGWYVHKNDANSKTPGSQTQNPDTQQPTPTPDRIADWVAYSNAEGKYSLKHPKTWVEAANPERCTDGLLLLGADSDSVGKCASSSFGHMAIASSEGDYREQNKLTTGYADRTESAATADGVTGVRESATASGQEGNLGGLNDGTKVVRYTFFTNGRTYTATYVQKSGYPDVLTDFGLLVTKTLKFSE